MKPLSDLIAALDGRRLRLMLQTETSECGLACLGMIAGFHGHHTDMNTLRQRFPVSQKGATLAQLMAIAGQLHLCTRPLKLALDDLHKLRLPCVLHWNFNHFVVLQQVEPRHATLYDPARGIVRVERDAISAAFTGVALELWPAPEFLGQPAPPAVGLGQLLGRVRGLGGALAQVLALAAGLELCVLAAPFYLQWVIDHVLLAADTALLTTLALGFSLLLLAQQALSAARAWMLMFVGATLGMQWRGNLLRHLLRLPPAHFRKRHLGDVVSRFGAMDAIQKTLTSSCIEALLDGAMAILTLAMMFLYQPLLPWLSLAAMALYLCMRAAWYAPLRGAAEEQLVHAARQQTHFLESVRGIATIKSMQREGERHAGWLALLAAQVNAELRGQKLSLLYRSANGVLFGLERIAVIWAGAQLTLDGALTAGALLAFIAYREQFISRASALADKLFELRMLRLHCERLADIALAPPESTGTPAPRPPHAVPPRITVRKLHFRHAEHEADLLAGLDLEIAGGESVAIVGASGCGKSTLLQLLLGNLAPRAGDILLDGKPLAAVGLAQLRGMCGTVLQEDTLFAGSIADNIAFFDGDMDMEWVRECAAMAAILEDIEAMPMGMNTLIGDMGAALSGGQRQRLLLARALYRRPLLLLLDEATSELDLANERRVNAAIGALRVTRIIIAHRPETIASADRVISLAAGRVAEEIRLRPPPQAATKR